MNHGLDQTTIVDWAGLNPDLLHIIIKKLGDISNLMCFRAVCKAWKSATRHADLPAHPSPWILHRPYENARKLKYYSISSHELYSIPFPESHFIKGPLDGGTVTSHGYVLTFQHGRPRFMNPLTLDEVFINVDDDTVECVPVSIFYKGIRNGDDFDLVLSCYERKNDARNNRHRLYIWQGGNKKWIRHDCPLIYSLVYWNELLFVRYRGSNIRNATVVDETTGNVLTTIPLPEYFDYLISTGEWLLGVRKTYARFEPIEEIEHVRFEVYRLENYEENPHWVKLSGIGDLIIFLDWGKGFSLTANDLHGFKGNCIYFFPSVKIDVLVGRFDLGENKTESVRLRVGFGEKNFHLSWYVPNLY